MNEEKQFIIEDAFARIEEIHAALENPETSLKESMELYSEGVKLSTACRDYLQTMEKEIQILNEV
ncbi:MAG: exodeoxyribonuclease VII small subunit [Eubacteriales bacterium]|nr:exodeoxyribonuclease VII small subunit [Lachnospiraceae bacterium]MDO5126545.1 exodeoxyribonuclease VII small subunit [Eubacteriales bacterium]